VPASCINRMTRVNSKQVDDAAPVLLSHAAVNIDSSVVLSPPQLMTSQNVQQI